MTSRFVNREIARLELGDGDWVEFLTRLSFWQREQIKKALYRPIVIAGRKKAIEKGNKALSDEDMKELMDQPDAEPDNAGSNRALMEQALVAWGGPGFCSQAEHPHAGECTPVPITRQAIEQLDEIGEEILVELEKRMVKPTPDFTKRGSPDSSTEAASEPSPSESIS